MALVITFLATFSGMARIIVTKKGPEAWVENDKGAKVGKIHRWVSYIILFVANYACGSGVITYFKDITLERNKMPLVGLTLPLFVLIVIGLEVNKRIVNKIKSLDFGETTTHP